MTDFQSTRTLSFKYYDNLKSKMMLNEKLLSGGIMGIPD